MKKVKTYFVDMEEMEINGIKNGSYKYTCKKCGSWYISNNKKVNPLLPEQWHSQICIEKAPLLTPTTTK